MQIVEIWGFHIRVVSCFTTPYQLVAGCTHSLEKIAGFTWSQHCFSAALERTHHNTRYHRTHHNTRYHRTHHHTPQYTVPPNRKTAEKIRNLSFFSNLTAAATSFLSGFIAISIRVKVGKVTLVQALRLCTGRTAHRGSRGITTLSWLRHWKIWGVSVRPRPLFTPGKDKLPILQEAAWAPRAHLDRCGKSRPYQDSIPGPSSP